MNQFTKPSEPGASFGRSVSNAFKNYFTFSGRSSRAEYWWFQLFQILTITLPMVVAMVAGVNSESSTWTYDSYYEQWRYEYHTDEGLLAVAIVFGIVAGVISLASFFPSLALVVRRLHDTGKSGWMYFICLIPLIGGLILLILMCTETERYVNEYGGVAGHNFPPKYDPATYQPPVGGIPQPQTPPNRPQGGNNIAAELERLNNLLQQGIITQQEFDALKAKLIGNL